MATFQALPQKIRFTRSALPVVAVVLLAAAGSIAFRGKLQGKMRDFEVYWTAGARAAAAAPLYRPEDGHYQLKYLPGFAVAVTPLARLPLDAAKGLWVGLSIASLWILVRASVRSAHPTAMRAWLVGTLTVVVLAKFYAHELVLGQANLLFAAICAGGLAALLRRSDTMAGLALGLATLVKPYAVGFVPYLLMVGRWRSAGSAIVAVTAVLVLPAFVYGPAGTFDLTTAWWATAAGTSAPLLTNADSVSVFAMYAKWIGWGQAALVLSAATILLLAGAGALAVVRRGGVERPETLEVGLILTSIPLVTPQGWDYVLLLATPLVALLVARAPRMRGAERAVLATALGVSGLSLFDVMGRAAYARFMGSAIVTVCYLAVFAVAVRARLRGLA